MKANPKTPLIIGIALVACAILAPVSIGIYAFSAKEYYQSDSLLIVTPSPEVILQDGFRESILGRASSVRFERRGANIVRIIAEALSPKEAVDAANDAVTKVLIALAQKGGGKVSLIQTATPPVRPFRPNKPKLLLIGIGWGALLALAGGVSLAAARRWAEES